MAARRARATRPAGGQRRILANRTSGRSNFQRASATGRAAQWSGATERRMRAYQSLSDGAPPIRPPGRFKVFIGTSVFGGSIVFSVRCSDVQNSPSVYFWTSDWAAGFFGKAGMARSGLPSRA